MNNPTTTTGNVTCYNCNTVLPDYDEFSKISRHDECFKCKTILRCCKMCHFYDVLTYNECKEINAERILDKERPNYCSYFQVAINAGSKKPDKDRLLDAASKLFKD